MSQYPSIKEVGIKKISILRTAWAIKQDPVSNENKNKTTLPPKLEYALEKCALFLENSFC
jgi:hypothetical protein